MSGLTMLRLLLLMHFILSAKSLDARWTEPEEDFGALYGVTASTRSRGIFRRDLRPNITPTVKAKGAREEKDLFDNGDRQPDLLTSPEEPDGNSSTTDYDYASNEYVTSESNDLLTSNENLLTVKWDAADARGGEERPIKENFIRNQTTYFTEDTNIFRKNDTESVSIDSVESIFEDLKENVTEDVIVDVDRIFSADDDQYSTATAFPLEFSTVDLHKLFASKPFHQLAVGMTKNYTFQPFQAFNEDEPLTSTVKNYFSRVPDPSLFEIEDSVDHLHLGNLEESSGDESLTSRSTANYIFQIFEESGGDESITSLTVKDNVSGTSVPLLSEAADHLPFNNSEESSGNEPSTINWKTESHSTRSFTDSTSRIRTKEALEGFKNDLENESLENAKETVSESESTPETFGYDTGKALVEEESRKENTGQQNLKDEGVLANDTNTKSTSNVSFDSERTSINEYQTTKVSVNKSSGQADSEEYLTTDGGRFNVAEEETKTTSIVLDTVTTSQYNIEDALVLMRKLDQEDESRRKNPVLVKDYFENEESASGDGAFITHYKTLEKEVDVEEDEKSFPEILEGKSKSEMENEWNDNISILHNVEKKTEITSTHTSNDYPDVTHITFFSDLDLQTEVWNKAIEAVEITEGTSLDSKLEESTTLVADGDSDLQIEVGSENIGLVEIAEEARAERKLKESSDSVNDGEMYLLTINTDTTQLSVSTVSSIEPQARNTQKMINILPQTEQITEGTSLASEPEESTTSVIDGNNSGIVEISEEATLERKLQESNKSVNGGEMYSQTINRYVTHSSLFTVSSIEPLSNNTEKIVNAAETDSESSRMPKKLNSFGQVSKNDIKNTIKPGNKDKDMDNAWTTQKNVIKVDLSEPEMHGEYVYMDVDSSKNLDGTMDQNFVEYGEDMEEAVPVSHVEDDLMQNQIEQALTEEEVLSQRKKEENILRGSIREDFLTTVSFRSNFITTNIPFENTFSSVSEEYFAQKSEAISETGIAEREKMQTVATTGGPMSGSERVRGKEKNFTNGDYFKLTNSSSLDDSFSLISDSIEKNQRTTTVVTETEMMETQERNSPGATDQIDASGEDQSKTVKSTVDLDSFDVIESTSAEFSSSLSTNENFEESTQESQRTTVIGEYGIVKSEEKNIVEKDIESISAVSVESSSLSTNENVEEATQENQGNIEVTVYGIVRNEEAKSGEKDTVRTKTEDYLDESTVTGKYNIALRTDVINFEKKLKELEEEFALWTTSVTTSPFSTTEESTNFTDIETTTDPKISILKAFQSKEEEPTSQTVTVTLKENPGYTVRENGFETNPTEENNSKELITIKNTASTFEDVNGEAIEEAMIINEKENTTEFNVERSTASIPNKSEVTTESIPSTSYYYNKYVQKELFHSTLGSMLGEDFTETTITKPSKEENDITGPDLILSSTITPVHIETTTSQRENVSDSKRQETTSVKTETTQSTEYQVIYLLTDKIKTLNETVNIEAQTESSSDLFNSTRSNEGEEEIYLKDRQTPEDSSTVENITSILRFEDINVESSPVTFETTSHINDAELFLRNFEVTDTTESITEQVFTLRSGINLKVGDSWKKEVINEDKVTTYASKAEQINTIEDGAKNVSKIYQLNNSSIAFGDRELSSLQKEEKQNGAMGDGQEETTVENCIGENVVEITTGESITKNTSEAENVRDGDTGVNHLKVQTAKDFILNVAHEELGEENVIVTTEGISAFSNLDYPKGETTTKEVETKTYSIATTEVNELKQEEMFNKEIVEVKLPDLKNEKERKIESLKTKTEKELSSEIIDAEKKMEENISGTNTETGLLLTTVTNVLKEETVTFISKSVPEFWNLDSRNRNHLINEKEEIAPLNTKIEQESSAENTRAVQEETSTVTSNVEYTSMLLESNNSEENASKTTVGEDEVKITTESSRYELFNNFEVKANGRFLNPLLDLDYFLSNEEDEEENNFTKEEQLNKILGDKKRNENVQLDSPVTTYVESQTATEKLASENILPHSNQQKILNKSGKVFGEISKRIFQKYIDVTTTEENAYRKEEYASERNYIIMEEGEEDSSMLDDDRMQMNGFISNLPESRRGLQNVNKLGMNNWEIIFDYRKNINSDVSEIIVSQQRDVAARASLNGNQRQIQEILNRTHLNFNLCNTWMKDNEKNCLATGRLNISMTFHDFTTYIPGTAEVSGLCDDQRYTLDVKWVVNETASGLLSLQFRAGEIFYWINSVYYQLHLSDKKHTQISISDLKILETQIGHPLQGRINITSASGLQLLIHVIDFTSKRVDNCITTEANILLAHEIAMIIGAIVLSTVILLTVVVFLLYKKFTTTVAVYKMAIE